MSSTSVILRFEATRQSYHSTTAITKEVRAILRNVRLRVRTLQPLPYHSPQKKQWIFKVPNDLAAENTHYFYYTSSNKSSPLKTINQKLDGYDSVAGKLTALDHTMFLFPASNNVKRPQSHEVAIQASEPDEELLLMKKKLFTAEEQVKVLSETTDILANHFGGGSNYSAISKEPFLLSKDDMALQLLSCSHSISMKDFVGYKTLSLGKAAYCPQCEVLPEGQRRSFSRNWPLTYLSNALFHKEFIEVHAEALYQLREDSRLLDENTIETLFNSSNNLDYPLSPLLATHLLQNGGQVSGYLRTQQAHTPGASKFSPRKYSGGVMRRVPPPPMTDEELISILFPPPSYSDVVEISDDD